MAAVLGYIKYCIDTVTVDKCIRVYTNRKTWMTKEVYRLLKKRNTMFRPSGGRQYSAARANIKRGFREAKLQKPGLCGFQLMFNAIVPQRLVYNLTDLGLSTSICNRFLDFLLGRSKRVRVGLTSTALSFSTGILQGCALSHLLYTLYTFNCNPTYPSYTIIKFADNTTVVVLISWVGGSVGIQGRGGAAIGVV